MLAEKISSSSLEPTTPTDDLSHGLARHRRFSPRRFVASAFIAASTALASCGEAPKSTGKNQTGQPDPSPTAPGVGNVIGPEGTSFYATIQVGWPIDRSKDARLTSGPHDWRFEPGTNMNSYPNVARNEIDIAPMEIISCANPSATIEFDSIATASGTITSIDNGGGIIKMKDEDDRTHQFTHVGSPSVNITDEVEKGDTIAKELNCKSDTSGLHLDYAMFDKDNNPIPMTSIGFDGATITEFPDNYQGMIVMPNGDLIVANAGKCGPDLASISSKDCKGTTNIIPAEKVLGATTGPTAKPTEMPTASLSPTPEPSLTSEENAGKKYVELVSKISDGIVSKPTEAAAVVSKISAELPSDPKEAADTLALLVWLASLNTTQGTREGFGGERYESDHRLITRIKNLDEFSSQIPIILSGSFSSPSVPLIVEFKETFTALIGQDRKPAFKVLGEVRIHSIHFLKDYEGMVGELLPRGILFDEEFHGHAYELQNPANEEQIKAFINDFTPHGNYPGWSRTHGSFQRIDIWGDRANPARYPSKIIINDGTNDTSSLNQSQYGGLLFYTFGFNDWQSYGSLYQARYAPYFVPGINYGDGSGPNRQGGADEGFEKIRIDPSLYVSEQKSEPIETPEPTASPEIEHVVSSDGYEFDYPPEWRIKEDRKSSATGEVSSVYNLYAPGDLDHDAAIGIDRDETKSEKIKLIKEVANIEDEPPPFKNDHGVIFTVLKFNAKDSNNDKFFYNYAITEKAGKAYIIITAAPYNNLALRQETDRAFDIFINSFSWEN